MEIIIKISLKEEDQTKGKVENLIGYVCEVIDSAFSDEEILEFRGIKVFREE